MAKRRHYPAVQKDTAETGGEQRALKRVKLVAHDEHCEDVKTLDHEEKFFHVPITTVTVDEPPSYLSKKQRQRWRQRQRKAELVRSQVQSRQLLNHDATTVATENPPADLNSTQRRKWRRRQKKAELGLGAKQSSLLRERAGQQCHDCTSEEGAIVRGALLDSALLSRFTTTHLLRCPEKEWVDQSPALAILGRQSSSQLGEAKDGSTISRTDGNMVVDRPHQQARPKVIRSTGLVQRTSTLLEGNELHARENVTHADLSFSTIRLDQRVSLRHTSQQRAPQGTQNSFVIPASMKAGFAVHIRPKHDAGLETMQPISRRAVAVPVTSVSSTQDVQTAFRKFSEYLVGGSDEDSDSDSDSTSESEAGDDSEKVDTRTDINDSRCHTRDDPNFVSTGIDTMLHDYQRIVEEDGTSEEDDSSSVGSLGDAPRLVEDTTDDLPDRIIQDQHTDTSSLDEDEEDTDCETVVSAKPGVLPHWVTSRARTVVGNAHVQANDHVTESENTQHANGNWVGLQVDAQRADDVSESDSGDDNDDAEGAEDETTSPPRSQSHADCDNMEAGPEEANTTIQTVMSTAVWPANVGRKRRLSLQGHRCGEEDLRRGLSSEPALDARPFPSVLAEDEDLFKTIDEVTSGIFESTRPLPASKLDSSSEDPLREHHILTHPVSDRRLKPLGIGPVAGGSRLLDRVRTPSPQFVICNSAQVSNGTTDAVSECEQSEPPHHGDGCNPEGRAPLVQSSSSLSELARTPSPPPELADVTQRPLSNSPEVNKDESVGRSAQSEQQPSSAIKKRKMTGVTSKHFTPEKRKRSTKAVAKAANAERTQQNVDSTIDNDERPCVVHDDNDNDKQEMDAKTLEAIVDAADRLTLVSQRTRSAAKETPSKSTKTPSKPTETPSKSKRKSTGKKSEHFLPFHLLDRVDLPTPNRRGRVPAGVSTAPVPSILSERFGIIQEKLSDQPFWLIIATTFLNKTAGRSAVPTFWALKERFPTPEDLAQADQGELHDMIHHLGLQTQRSKRLIKISEAWVANPPRSERRYRTLHYPAKNDGKQYTKTEVVDADAQDPAGALEIGHIPGCGPYAWDSWRIFCRDALRGVAEDHNGRGADEQDFEPEWKRVIPLDKELRATLRWMWLKEGFIWNHETGERRSATEEEMQRAVQGEMEVPDAGELKFAMEAAAKVDASDADPLEGSTVLPEPRLEELVAIELAKDESSEECDNIVVAFGRQVD